MHVSKIPTLTYKWANSVFSRLYHHHGYNMLDWHFFSMFAHTFAKPMKIKTETEELLI